MFGTFVSLNMVGTI